jgi:hypothetical protein
VGKYLRGYNVQADFSAVPMLLKVRASLRLVDMKTSRYDKLKAQLAATEVDLLDLLRRQLPHAVHVGGYLFVNSKFLPDYVPLYRVPPESEMLLSLARESLSLREQLQLPAEGTAAQMYLSACAEHSNVENEHRRGPRQLAAWLLGQL